MALNPEGPYPILIINGEQGAAKSTTEKFLRSIIDPNSSLLRSPPRNEHDLVIAANNSWVLAYDNLSGIEDWLSDGFCRIASGAGFACRQLYSDKDEILFHAFRPVMLNGIDSLVSRGDLADRALLIVLPPIPETKRLAENEFMRQFQGVLPSVLGGLCSAVSEALKNKENVHLEKTPRMADFSVWVTAAEPALGWKKGGFMEVYSGNRTNVIELSIGEDPVGDAIRNWVDAWGMQSDWKGTASELLDELEKIVDKKTKESKSWPKAANALSWRLNRLSNFLRAVGIEISKGEREGKKRSRSITVKKVADNVDAKADDLTPADDLLTKADDPTEKTVRQEGVENNDFVEF